MKSFISFSVGRMVFVALMLVLISGCGVTSTSIEATVEEKVDSGEEQARVGTNGQLIPIQSDNVKAAGYDASSMVMTVQFDNGALYAYYDVPAELWTSFVGAQPHPWSQVGYPRLVQGGIPYKRIR
jgi:hypothetical protein